MDEDDSPFSISIAHQSERACVDSAVIGAAVERTLLRFGRERAEISIALLDDARIAELHERYLDTSGPTDCITFNLGDDPAIVEGEIVISCDTAAREADARGHALGSELLLYAVHGTLHLLGMDDATAPEAAKMHAMEDEILGEMGIGPIYAVDPS